MGEEQQSGETEPSGPSERRGPSPAKTRVPATISARIRRADESLIGTASGHDLMGPIPDLTNRSKQLQANQWRTNSTSLGAYTPTYI